MSEWLKSMVGFVLIASVTMQMLPNQKYEQYVRLFTGFLLIILVLRPILKMGSVDVYLEKKMAEFVKEQEEIEEKAAKKGMEFYENVTNTVEIPEITRVEVSVDD